MIDSDALTNVDWVELDRLLTERFGDDWRETTSVEDLLLFTAELRARRRAEVEAG